jgi:PIN domain nuclease of toxin-antitoxin system
VETFAVTYLLDTHAAIWALQDAPELGSAARAVIARESRDSLAISDISLFEVAMLAAKGRIEFDDGLSSALRLISGLFSVVPIDGSIAANAVNLPLPHSDPFDRIIVATARRHELTLLTRDREISKSGLIDVVW